MYKQYFLDKIKERHPTNFDYYNYDDIPDVFKVIDKIPIKCFQHGIFYQRPIEHFQGHGYVEAFKVSRHVYKRFKIDGKILVANLVNEIEKRTEVVKSLF